jgi:hypothetical protein
MLFVAWLYRQIFHCCRRVDSFLFAPVKTQESQVPVSSLPWLWVGATYPDGVTVEFTNEVNENIEFGMHITPEWLDDVFDLTDVTWRYLDPKTLEEKDFPSTGFVIDDPEPTNSEIKSDSPDPLNNHTE